MHKTESPKLLSNAQPTVVSQNFSKIFCKVFEDVAHLRAVMFSWNWAAVHGYRDLQADATAAELLCHEVKRSSAAAVLGCEHR